MSHAMAMGPRWGGGGGGGGGRGGVNARHAAGRFHTLGGAMLFDSESPALMPLS